MSDTILICTACAVGLLEECRNPKPGHAPGWIIPCSGQIAETQGARAIAEVRAAGHQRGGQLLEPDELTNDTSAGRKRAAMLAPIMNGMTCEWAWLKFAGGGVLPIFGCTGNRIAKAKSNEDARILGADEVGHIHHGPDKAVLNNAVGVNLHRVCSRCHNRWHAINDPYYAAERPHVSGAYLPEHAYFPHDPSTRYDDREHVVSEAWWKTPKDNREIYPFFPGHLPRLVGADKLTTANNLFEEPDTGDSE